jgi:triosephosphate isomerase
LLAPPAPLLSWFSERHPHQIVAQEVTPHLLGAHTGALGPEYLSKLGIRYTLIGHQEQRARKLEQDYIEQQYLACLEQHVIPILCFGEAQQQHYKDEIYHQIAFLQSLEKPVFLAYEPVWAIGQAQYCSVEHLSEVHHFVSKIIRPDLIKDFFYGGSILDASRAIIDNPVLTGFLLGRLSLDLPSLEKFIKDYQQHIEKSSETQPSYS